MLEGFRFKNGPRKERTVRMGDGGGSAVSVRPCFFFAGRYKIEARSFVVSDLRSGTFARKAKVPSSGPAASYVQR